MMQTTRCIIICSCWKQPGSLIPCSCHFLMAWEIVLSQAPCLDIMTYKWRIEAASVPQTSLPVSHPWDCIRDSDSGTCSLSFQISRDFLPGTRADGPTDPLTVHVFYPPALSGLWSALREAVVADGTLARWKKEAVAAIVSKSNECAFCIAAHVDFASGAGGGRWRAIASVIYGLLETWFWEHVWMQRRDLACRWIRKMISIREGLVPFGGKVSVFSSPKCPGFAFLGLRPRYVLRCKAGNASACRWALVSFDVTQLDFDTMLQRSDFHYEAPSEKI